MGRKPATSGPSVARNAKMRLQRELADFHSNPADRQIYFIETVDDNVFDLRGHLNGPPDSPYAGGTFRLEVKVPETYPFQPPKCKFITRLWHPNVSSQTGVICLDILKDKWAASLTIRTIMLSLQALLTSAEPDDPQDGMVARQYKEKPEMYKLTAAYWTYVFAIELKTPEMNEYFKNMNANVDALMAMVKCERGAALSALSCNGWSLDEAKKYI